jgi:adenylate cyclase
MNRIDRFRIRNAMLIANLISNAVGIVVVNLLGRVSFSTLPDEILGVLDRTNWWFIPTSILIPWGLTLLYERPIRKHIQEFLWGEEPEAQAAVAARRRLLNEPFFLIVTDFAMWVVAAWIYPKAALDAGAGPDLIQGIMARCLLTGLITVTVAFFVFEFVLQRRVAPYLFPDGRLYAVPGTKRVRIRTRLVGLLFACNLVPFFAVLISLMPASNIQSGPGEMPSAAWGGVLAQVVIFMGVGVWLTFLVSSNLTRPLQEIVRVLQRVRRGDFQGRIRVTTNDEIGYTGDVINEMTRGLREREVIKETFGKYVTDEVRDEILSGKVPLDGELREVTVLFADLRGFTPLSERLPPKDVVKILNQYFREMEETIRRHRGLVLQYIGDEIEAVFGAPVRVEDHASRATHAAQEMTTRLRSLNEALVQQGYPALSHGIGIHTGEVVAASIGSPDRLSYTLVGDTVNLASRLQELNKALGTEVILSGATRERLGRGIPLKALPPQRVKGRSQVVEIYTVPS